MGKAAAPGKPPRGVIIRTDIGGSARLQIAFSYEGHQCREVLPPGNVTRAYIDYAAGLRAEIRRKIADGIFDYLAYFPDSPKAKEFAPKPKFLLLGQLLNRQLALYEKQAENETISASTLLGYSKLINNTLIPQWGATALSDLSPSLLRAWISGMGVTGKTIRNLLTPLRSVLDDAVNDDLIMVNPLDRVALKKLIKQTAIKSEYEVDPFDHEETTALLKAARDDERPMVQFWLAGGLRPGEMIALQWTSIDWVHGTVRIEDNSVTGMRDGKRVQVSKQPKTESGKRDVALTPDALSALRAQKAYTFIAGTHIWHDPRKSEPWSDDASFRKSLWLPLCKRAGIRYRNPYQMRHTFASTLLTGGCNPFWLADQMGHADAEMVFKIYGKWIPANFKRANRFTQDSHEAEESSAEVSVRR